MNQSRLVPLTAPVHSLKVPFSDASPASPNRLTHSLFHCTLAPLTNTLVCPMMLAAVPTILSLVITPLPPPNTCPANLPCDTLTCAVPSTFAWLPPPKMSPQMIAFSLASDTMVPNGANAPFASVPTGARLPPPNTVPNTCPPFIPTLVEVNTEPRLPPPNTSRKPTFLYLPVYSPRVVAKLLMLTLVMLQYVLAP